MRPAQEIRTIAALGNSFVAPSQTASQATIGQAAGGRTSRTCSAQSATIVTQRWTVVTGARIRASAQQRGPSIATREAAHLVPTSRRTVLTPGTADFRTAVRTPAPTRPHLLAAQLAGWPHGWPWVPRRVTMGRTTSWCGTQISKGNSGATSSLIQENLVTGPRPSGNPRTTPDR